MKTKLSIVFLNYNRLVETRFTSEFLAKTVQKRQDIEVIAVDNASVDGTWEYLQSQTWMQVLRRDKNLGIEGYNAAFELTKGEFILVLDDDSHPQDLATLNHLIEQLDQNPDWGVIACNIVGKQGNRLTSWHLPENNKAGQSMFFIGCGFIIRRQLFKKIGWYPASFFLYQNELDVAFQVRQLGYQIRYDPEAKVIHRNESVDSRPNWRRLYYATRNTIWLLRRYFPLPQSLYLIASRLIIGLVGALRSGEWSWYFKAVKHAFSEPITPQILSPDLRKEMDKFWKQNSLWHQITRQL